MDKDESSKDNLGKRIAEEAEKMAGYDSGTLSRRSLEEKLDKFFKMNEDGTGAMKDVLSAVAKRGYFIDFIDFAYKENFVYETHREAISRVQGFLQKELKIPDLNLRSEYNKLKEHGKLSSDSPPISLVPYLENDYLKNLMEATDDKILIDGDLKSVFREERLLKRQVKEDQNLQSFINIKLTNEKEGGAPKSLFDRTFREMLDYLIDGVELSSREDVSIFSVDLDKQIQANIPEYKSANKWSTRHRNDKGKGSNDFGNFLN